MSALGRFALGVALLVGACRDDHGDDPPVRLFDAGDLGPVDVPYAHDTGPDAPETPDAASDPTRLRVATYNVHRLFDTVCDSGRCTSTDFEEAPSQAEFDRQVDRIANGILRLDADVVILQEIETRVGLDALQQRLEPRYPVAVLGEIGTPGSVDVAVLADARYLSTFSHRDRVITRPDGSSTRFSRELLEVHVDVRGHRVAVFAAHFRSMVDDDQGRRIAEAAAAREIVSDTARALPDALVILGGDLNDVPGSAALQALEMGGELHRVASDLPPEQAYTYRYHDTRHALDHLYVSTLASGRYRPGSALVLRDGDSGLGGSDHAALRADFDLPR